MTKRHIKNKNLTLFNQANYRGLPIQRKYLPCMTEYLEEIHGVFNSAIKEHTRTLIIRVDLHLPGRPVDPDYPQEFESNIISKFIESFKAQIKADIKAKKRKNSRTHPCRVRYVWAKEWHDPMDKPELQKCHDPLDWSELQDRYEPNGNHYHVGLFLNKDTYNELGWFGSEINNMATRIIDAWISALDINPYEAAGLVYFPRNCVYHIDNSINNSSRTKEIEDAFYRLSYLAKAKTKNYGDRSNSFGCSRK